MKSADVRTHCDFNFFFCPLRAGAGEESATADLEAKRKALDDTIAKAKARWREVQDKVDG